MRSLRLAKLSAVAGGRHQKSPAETNSRTPTRDERNELKARTRVSDNDQRGQQQTAAPKEQMPTVVDAP
jgi:hypothetical protein